MRPFVGLVVLVAVLTACLDPRVPPGITGTVYAPIQFAAAPGYERVDLEPFQALVRFKSADGARAQSLGNVLEPITENTVLLRMPQSVGGRAQSLADQKTQTLQWVSALRARSDVVFAEPNSRLQLQTVPEPNDSSYASQWNLRQLKLPAAWNGFASEKDVGAGVTVAVLDSGILWDRYDPAKRHADFNCEVAPGVSKIAPGYDFAASHPDPTDPKKSLQGDDNPYDDKLEPSGAAVSGYHGSHVAGTVGACSNNALGVAGVAWQSRILPVRVFDGDSGTIADVAKGILWAVGAPIPASPGVSTPPINPNPAQVLNLSLGAPQAPSPTLQDAVNEANARGAVVVVAAGNDGDDASLETPANLQGVIVVGALGPEKERASYSNYGASVSVVAPGGDIARAGKVADGILSTMGCGPTATDLGDFYTPVGGQPLPCAAGSQSGYGTLNGTSMSTPHVAGVVALMMSRQAALLNPVSVSDKANNWTRVLSYLRDASSLNGVTGCERGCGAGLVDAAAAVTIAVSLPPVGPVLIRNAPLGGINLGTSQTVATFALKNIGDAAVSVNLSVAGPNLTVSPAGASLAPNATQTFTLTLNRTGLKGDYAARVTATYGTRQLEARVYYQQGVNAIANAGGYFVRIYKEASGGDRQRLNYPDTPLSASGSFSFPRLERGVYDLTAYHLVSTNPDGTVVVDQLGESLGVDVQADQVSQTVTLEPVTQTICSRDGTVTGGPTKCPGK
jgi:serine protease